MRTPDVSSVHASPDVELLFNQLALRQTSLLQNDEWHLRGWAMDKDRGLANTMQLDQEALAKGSILQVTNRPDVALALLHTELREPAQALAGFNITLRTAPPGNLVIDYPEKKVLVPLAVVLAIKPSEEIIQEGVHIHLDERISPEKSAGLGSILFSRLISNGMHLSMWALIPLIPIILILIAGMSCKTVVYGDTLFIVALTASIVIPKVLLLAAIDSTMFPCYESRYMAAGAFAVWFTASYLGAVLIWLIFSKVHQTFKRV